MPVTIDEKFDSRSFQVGSQEVTERTYIAMGSYDETEILAAAVPPLGAVPAVANGLVLDSINADPLGGGVWNVFARYVQSESDSEYTFDTGGGSVRITQALETINSYAPPGLTAPDFDGAIGVSDDRVEGVDIITPVFNFTETHSFEDADVDEAYRLTLFNMTGRYNDAPFRGLAAGECRLEGVSGSKRGYERWSITFRFAGSPNATGLTVGGITGIDKLGWHYMWVRYADFEDATAYALVKRPVAAYVVRVSEPGDFSTLGIGT